MERILYESKLDKEESIDLEALQVFEDMVSNNMPLPKWQ